MEGKELPSVQFREIVLRCRCDVAPLGKDEAIRKRKSPASSTTFQLEISLSQHFDYHHWFTDARYVITTLDANSINGNHISVRSERGDAVINDNTKSTRGPLGTGHHYDRYA